MKPHTRRIWIFIGLKLKEIWSVLRWIVGSVSLMFGIWLFHFKILQHSWGEAISYVFLDIFLFVLIGLTCIGLYGLVGALCQIIKKWLKSNWRKAGQIEKQTRGK